MAEPRSIYVGAPVFRREDSRLLLGRATFIDDVPEPFGTVFLAFARSPHAHARIKSIDTSAAMAARGVIAVLTGADIAAGTKPIVSPTLKGEPQLVRQNMAIEEVRHVGETVAVVVAENAYLAEDAIELVEVEYEQLPCVLSIADALAPGSARVHEYLAGNRVFNLKYEVPGTAEVFSRAQHVMSDRFSSERLSGVAMETRGFLTSFDRGTNKLRHMSTAQLPHKMRWELADALQLPEMSVQVIAPHVGGSFGMKTVTFPEDVVGAVISRKLGRPVKWIQDRQEDLALMHAREYRFDVEMAFDADGHILAVRNTAVVNIGAYPLWIATAGIEAGGAGHHMMGPYRIKHYAYDVSSVVTHKAPVASYRGVASPMCALSTETLLERMAARLGIDSVEVRRRNLLRPADLPFVNAVGIPHDTASHLECLDKALALTDYEQFKRTRSGKLGADGKYRGIGIACIADHNGQGTSIARSRGQSSRWPGYDGAFIRIEPDGKAVCHVSLASQGQGHQTVFAQIIADELGLPIEDVTIEHSDTAMMPFGTGTAAARAAVAGGGAVLKASQRIAAKLRRIASYLMEASPDDIVLANGKAAVPGAPELSVDIRQIAATAYVIGPQNLPQGETIGLEATEFYDPPTSSYSNATHAVQLAVDSKTGQVTIEKYVVVHDCGKRLNPLIVDGQIIGGVAQGIGSVLTEAMRFNEEGQPLTTTLLDYTVPTFLDVPRIEVHHIESVSTINPGGMKGVGEAGTIGAVPAVVMALNAAMVQFSSALTALPVWPGTLMDVMHGKQ